MNRILSVARLATAVAQAPSAKAINRQPRRLSLIRQGLACEGLWMVTRNEQLTGFGDVLGLARRISFILRLRRQLRLSDSASLSSSPIRRMPISGEVQTFTLGGGSVFARPRELTIACTPVAISGPALAAGGNRPIGNAMN